MPIDTLVFYICMRLLREELKKKKTNKQNERNETVIEREGEKQRRKREDHGTGFL